MEIWMKKGHNILSKEEFLNDLEYEEVTTEQQIYYLIFKKIEEIEEKILQLEQEIELLKNL